MESKFDYHVLTMDEIVFDNRNKSYGAFAIRRVYDKNLLKAMILSMGLFGLGMSSPAILQYLGLMTESQEAMIEESPYIFEDIPIIGVPKIITSQKTPSGPRVQSEIMVPVKPNDLVTDSKPEENGHATSTSTNDQGTGGGGGTETGGDVTTTPTIIIETPEKIFPGGVEVMPEFPGGEKAFIEYVDDNLPYPIPEKEDGIEGIVKVQFVVNKDGSIEQVRIAESSGYPNFDAAALKLVKSLPKHKPGRQNGHAVRVLCILPIGFELD